MTRDSNAAVTLSTPRKGQPSRQRKGRAQSGPSGSKITVEIGTPALFDVVAFATAAMFGVTVALTMQEMADAKTEELRKAVLLALTAAGGSRRWNKTQKRVWRQIERAVAAHNARYPDPLTHLVSIYSPPAHDPK